VHRDDVAGDELGGGDAGEPRGAEDKGFVGRVLAQGLRVSL
jgi:hypothetical protein